MALTLQVKKGLAGELCCTVLADSTWDVQKLTGAIADTIGAPAPSHVRHLVLDGRILGDTEILGVIFSDLVPVVSLMEVKIKQPMDVEFSYRLGAAHIPSLVRGEYYVNPDWLHLYSQEEFGGRFELPLEPVECGSEFKWLATTKKPPGMAHFKFVMESGDEITCARMPESIVQDGSCHSIDFNYLWDECLLAAECGDSEEMRRCINTGAPLESRNHDKETALIVASRGGYVECLRALLEGGADLQACDSNGSTALMAATSQGQLGCIRFLIGKGVDLEACRQDGSTAVAIAAEKGDEECLRLLLDQGACIDARDQAGNTAAMKALFKGHESCLQLLVRSGADVNAPNGNGLTTVLWAAARGHVRCLQILADVLVLLTRVGRVI